MFTSVVETAIRELRETFPGVDLDVIADGQGGAAVTTGDMWIGDGFAPTRSWVAFAITFQYDAADVYPHFLRPDLSRADGSHDLGAGMSRATWRGSPAVQVSRRSNAKMPGVDTAAIKLTKVLEWLRSR